MNDELKKRIAAINSGTVPEGYKRTKVGIVPEEWKERRLESFIVECNEKSTKNNQYPVLTSSRKGLFFQSDYYKKQVASEDNTGYNVVPYGYFTYRHMSDDEIFRFNINYLVEKGIVSTLYPVFTVDKINSQWLLHVLNYGNEFPRYARAQKQGGSRTYMYLEKLKKLKLALPPLPEQQKIAEILSTQDKLIELQEQKIEQLKALKKTYLQKMFPKKGSRYPELRFKGFMDAWEQRKLGELVEIGDIDHRMPSSVSDGIPYLMTGDFVGINELNFDNVKKISQEDYLLLSSKIKPEFGDILFARYASVGAARYVDFHKEFLISYSCAIIKKSEKIHSKYLYYFITSDIAQKQITLEINTGSQPNIGMDSMKRKICVSFPSSEEQKKISSFLSHLDSLITLHQRKLDQEKQKKKALMQLLLTGKVRVKP